MRTFTRGHVLKSRRRALSSIAPVLLLLGGCAHVKAYTQSRAADLADPFTFEASAGKGAHVLLQATDFAGTGAGWSDQHGVGIRGRYIGRCERDSGGLIFMSMSGAEEGGPLKPLVGDVPYPSSEEDYPCVYDDARGAMWVILPMQLAYFGPGAYAEGLSRRWHRFLDVSTGASIGVGLHICLSPGELADFVLGWSCLDIGQDDFHAPHAETDE